MNGQFIILDEFTVETDPNVQKTCLIEPQLPYLYLPKYDYLSLARQVATSFKGIGCHFTYCKWDYACKYVDIGDKKLIIKMFSEAANKMGYDLEFDKARLLIPGQDLGDSSNTCYLSVFAQDAK